MEWNMNKVRLILCLHNHQPVGNFDHVFENNYQNTYLPFLDVYENFSHLPLSLHYSGPLWDWLLEHHPEFIDRLKKLLEKGTVEMLAGAYYEPILAMIPEPDRQGQIGMMREFLKQTFGVDAQGFWLSERVWEQGFTSSLGDAGIKYTIMDDTHFINAGILGDRLLGYYHTEDHGRLISVFGTSERLRYIIPFHEPEDVRQYLAETAERNPGALLIYGDDGEKFGGWPGTHQRVYVEKWLERFFEMLQENSEWIELMTPMKALEQLKPLGKIYIPDSSYREMMEWALPVDAGHQYEHVVNVLREQIIWGEASVFIRGGFWRNFKYKYPEANWMYARMMEISSKMQKSKSIAPEEAKNFLYKAQCNCPYWHGVFGGLYLNHLRFETYRNLIRADYLLNESLHTKVQVQGQGIQKGQASRLTPSTRDSAGLPLQWEEHDFDFDGICEIALQNHWHRLYIQPHSGGRIYEWDYYPASTNLLDTLSRREEAYHQKIRETSALHGTEGAQSIHDLSKLHDLSIKDDLVYDPYERKSFLDHFLIGEISASSLRRNECTEIGNLPLSEYGVNHHFRDSSQIQKRKDSIRLSMTHAGSVEIDGVLIPFTLRKTLEMKRNSPALTCTYTIKNTGAEVMRYNFGMEWNFALLAGNADDRYYFYEGQPRAGILISELERENVQRFGLVDEWQRIKITFDYSEPVTLYTFPIETVSQSESAYEKVYQSSVIFPVIPLNLKPGEEKRISFIISIEQSR